MPTIRIDSWTTAYVELGHDKARIARDLVVAAGDILDEATSGIEARWNAPFDPDFQENTLRISIDMEFSMSIDDEIADRLAAVFWAIFDMSPRIHHNEEYGLWIKTPGQFYWRERIE